MFSSALIVSYAGRFFSKSFLEEMFLPVFDSHLWMCKNDVFIWLNIFCNSIIVWDQTRLLTLREYHPKMMMMNPLLVDENVFKGDFVTIFKSSVSIVQSCKWQKLTNPLLAFLMIWSAIIFFVSIVTIPNKQN